MPNNYGPNVIGSAIEGPENTIAVTAPMQGTIVTVDASEGDALTQGQQLLVMEAMKMEHVIVAPASGILGVLR